MRWPDCEWAHQRIFECHLKFIAARCVRTSSPGKFLVSSHVHSRKPQCVSNKLMWSIALPDWILCAFFAVSTQHKCDALNGMVHTSRHVPPANDAVSAYAWEMIRRMFAIAETEFGNTEANASANVNNRNYLSHSALFSSTRRNHYRLSSISIIFICSLTLFPLSLPFLLVQTLP